ARQVAALARSPCAFPPRGDGGPGPADRHPGASGRCGQHAGRRGAGERAMTVWDEVVGQPRAVATLQESAAAAHRVVAGEPAAASSMTHAWLFTGPPGSGRSVAARAFAAALECERDGAGCGECHGCHTVLGGTHADVRFVVPEGLSIGVNEMRNLVLRAGSAPSGGRWQAVVIEDADRLTEA